MSSVSCQDHIGVPAVLNKNPKTGKSFFTCGSAEKKCNFFCWEEDILSLLKSQPSKVDKENIGSRPTTMKAKGSGLAPRQTATTQPSKLTQQQQQQQPMKLKPVILPEYAELSLAELELKLARKKKIYSNAEIVATLPDKGVSLKIKINQMSEMVTLLKEKSQKVVSQPLNEIKVTEKKEPKIKLSEQLSNLSLTDKSAVRKTSTDNSKETTRTKYKTGVASVQDVQIYCESVIVQKEESEIPSVTPPSQLASKLFPHQQYALSWMVQREKTISKTIKTERKTERKVRGGIIADECGLGKTLQMISLIVHSKSISTATPSKELEGKTLVICPRLLLQQWEQEIESRVSKGYLTVYSYYGPQRRRDAKFLATHDVVITSYHMVLGDMCPKQSLDDGDDDDDAKEDEEDDGDEVQKVSGLLNLKWNRVIVDEGHVLRNPKAKITQAICALEAKKRWFLTATPLQNKLDDMYPVIKFLRLEPYDDYGTWKRVIKTRTDEIGSQRLKMLLDALVLRRTKKECLKNISLPKKTIQLEKLTFSTKEQEIYSRIWMACQERTKKNSRQNKEEPDASQLLTLLLRLRQSCVTCAVLPTRLVEPAEESEDESLTAGLSKLNIRSGDNEQKKIIPSTKIRYLLSKLKEIKTTEPTDKSIIFSEWTSVLDEVSKALNSKGFLHTRLDGATSAKQQKEALDLFRNDNETTIFLISLKAGGVGLNLTTANHVFMLDIWWNPAIERQAHDRVHRLGQTKPVTIHRLIISDSIEERILKMQKQKELLAETTLPKSKKQTEDGDYTPRFTLLQLQKLFE